MTLEIFLKYIGTRTAQLRKTHSLTQRDASERSQISYRYFQRIESGRANITIATLFKLSRLFNINICDLLPSKGEP